MSQVLPDGTRSLQKRPRYKVTRHQRAFPTGNGVIILTWTLYHCVLLSCYGAFPSTNGVNFGLVSLDTAKTVIKCCRYIRPMLSETVRPSLLPSSTLTVYFSSHLRIQASKGAGWGTKFNGHAWKFQHWQIEAEVFSTTPNSGRFSCERRRL